MNETETVSSCVDLNKEGIREEVLDPCEGFDDGENEEEGSAQGDSELFLVKSRGKSPTRDFGQSRVSPISGS